MNGNNTEYLTIRELSAYLKIKAGSLYAMVPMLPHYKVGRLVRFRKDEIDVWMQSRRVSFGEEEAREPKGGNEDGGKKERGDAKGDDTVKKKSGRAGRPTMMRNTDVDRLVRRSIDEFKGRKR
jgi:excisionase family DNA binding protein